MDCAHRKSQLVRLRTLFDGTGVAARILVCCMVTVWVVRLRTAIFLGCDSDGVRPEVASAVCLAPKTIDSVERLGGRGLRLSFGCAGGLTTGVDMGPVMARRCQFEWGYNDNPLSRGASSLPSRATKLTIAHGWHDFTEVVLATVVWATNTLRFWQQKSRVQYLSVRKKEKKCITLSKHLLFRSHKAIHTLISTTFLFLAKGYPCTRHIPMRD